MGRLHGGISAPVKRDQRADSPLLSVYHVRYSKVVSCCKRGRELCPGTELASTLTMDLLGSRTGRNKFLFFISHQIYGILLSQPS